MQAMSSQRSLHLATTILTLLYLEGEHPFQSLRPHHQIGPLLMGRKICIGSTSGFSPQPALSTCSLNLLSQPALSTCYVVRKCREISLSSLQVSEPVLQIDLQNPWPHYDIRSAIIRRLKEASYSIRHNMPRYPSIVALNYV